MEQEKYYKDGVARVLDLLRANFGDDFKAYFNGQAEPGESLYPCIMVSETQGQINPGATGTDEIEETILIIVSFNKKDDIGALVNTELTEQKIRRIVKGMDPTTQQYLPQSIMGVLRTNITMHTSTNDEAVIQSRIDTDFSLNVRKGTIVQEGYVTLYIKRLALVPSRT